MNKKTLTSLFSEALYQIPDYQRGYAWEEKQWDDFIQDIDALVEEKELTGHYTGTVVVYASRSPVHRDYGRKRLQVVDVVDGQQRLTTCCLYLSVILRALINKGEKDYDRDIADFLYAGATCKLLLANDTAHAFYDLLKNGRVNVEPRSPHEKRLISAYKCFQDHVDQQLSKRDGAGVQYLKDLYHAITQKLHFTFYTIEEECEIGMTFELMNSRGKDLSVLELLKNYLMHWIYRNEKVISERQTLSDLINKSWKATYTNIGLCDGDEDQCLRIAWTLYCSYSPENWDGYRGFKENEYIPLRNFTTRSAADTKAFIDLFVNGLEEISKHYASIVGPTEANTVSSDELLWLTKIHRTGNIANFLPVMVAARKLHVQKKMSEVDYVSLLKALECYAYRVFMYKSRRSNAGKSNFFRWGYKLFVGERTISEVITRVHNLTRHYAPEEEFIQLNNAPGNWYKPRHLLKYTLFEYENHLLADEGHGTQPRIAWEDLSDSTIEHILPQNPKPDSDWLKKWTPDDFKRGLHDIGNLVLTHDNSSYSNFEFVRKKGNPGEGVGYVNSDIRQERKLSANSDWTWPEFWNRRKQLAVWINGRWRTQTGEEVVPLLVDERADEDRTNVNNPS